MIPPLLLFKGKSSSLLVHTFEEKLLTLRWKPLGLITLLGKSVDMNHNYAPLYNRPLQPISFILQIPLEWTYSLAQWVELVEERTIGGLEACEI